MPRLLNNTYQVIQAVTFLSPSWRSFLTIKKRGSRTKKRPKEVRKKIARFWSNFYDWALLAVQDWIVTQPVTYCPIRFIGPSKLASLRTKTSLRHTGSFTLPLEGPRSLGWIILLFVFVAFNSPVVLKTPRRTASDVHAEVNVIGRCARLGLLGLVLFDGFS